MRACLVLMLCLAMVGAATARPLVIDAQGSFSVGGHVVRGKPGGINAGQSYWIDQMYVQYQKPPHPHPYPIVLVHGGGGTGRVWETTPDGREGYATILLRHGFSIYVVDLPRRGRSGIPSFRGPFGNLDGTQIVPDATQRSGREREWTQWRLGPAYGASFPGDQFPQDPASLDQFFQAEVPGISDDAQVMTDGLVALLDRIGPAIIVTHSQSGGFGWRLASQRPNLVKAIVAYEPGFVFPSDAVPPPIPLGAGETAAGLPMAHDAFAKLCTVPIEIVYGDNIPSSPVSDPGADLRRAQVVASVLFQNAAAQMGGHVEILHLPDVGLAGNTHFSFMDKNNLAVADQLLRFVHRAGAD